jgi:hypothetical protein
MALMSFTLLCLPAAGFFLVLNLKISPVDSTSQYNRLKNEMSVRRIAQPAEPISG